MEPNADWRTGGRYPGIANSNVDVVLLTSFSIHASLFERVAYQLSQLHSLLQTWLVSLCAPWFRHVGDDIFPVNLHDVTLFKRPVRPYSRFLVHSKNGCKRSGLQKMLRQVEM